MVKSEFKCERCGARAVVHIGHDPEYDNIIRDFCLRCADDVDEERRPRRGLNLAAIVVSSGLTILLLSLFADVLAFGRSPGFGWKQDIGVVIGACLVFVGAIMPVPTLLVIGLQAAALSLLADRLGFGSGEGFGPHQQLGTAAGIVILLIGLAWSRWKSRRGPQPRQVPQPSPPQAP
jgi:hypothetical protein